MLPQRVNVRERDTERLVSMLAQCSIPDCSKSVIARGWCGTHWTRWKRHGDPFTNLRPGVVKGLSVQDRFWEKVQFTDTCWLWMAFVAPDGYGRFWFEGQGQQAHRVAYFFKRGVWPVELDHLCRVRNCVNPNHLEAVTHKENVRRGEGWAGRNASKTHCPKGHPYDLLNTAFRDGMRYCRQCRLRTGLLEGSIQ